MKHIFLFLMLFTTSCIRNDSNEAVKKQIRELTTQYNKAWETLNVEQIATYHSNESFLYWGHGGLQCTSNDHFRNAFSKVLPMMKKWTVKGTSQFSVQALNQHSAISSFILDAESIGLDGTKGNHGSGALTYVWNKINGNWKIIHIHESVKK
jgi:ketosteroid isomerase-like protein